MPPTVLWLPFWVVRVVWLWSKWSDWVKVVAKCAKHQIIFLVAGLDWVPRSLILNIGQLCPMDFRHMFNNEGEDSDGGSSEDCWAHYCGSDDDYDDEESLEDRRDPEPRKRYEADAVYDEGADGAKDVEGAGLSWQVVVEDFLGREFGTEEDAYAAYKEFARFRGFGVRKEDVGRVNGILIRRDFFLPSTRY
ncbi:uncharacterized protein LOC127742539 isoform X1 [Arachis duranensis]|uniref:Uncharacterized protein LOC127742539 isoform X1 n=1 Tax=Arachis duranensis TaxID=130453 RepID=A0A9C6WDD5_ARADU|nr:uncharacterized protein LOC127742539 isoform X1 [Arachis duranensis]